MAVEPDQMKLAIEAWKSLSTDERQLVYNHISHGKKDATLSAAGAECALALLEWATFEAPSPLTQAMEADLLDQGRAAGMTGKTLEMHPFNALRVPRMIIELKQALGRLIRTQTDTGLKHPSCHLVDDLSAPR
jgi:hypothetical protein